jgi:hypothetical protein
MAMALLLACGAGRAQSAPVEIQVTAVDPESPALLRSGNSLSVRVAYKSDQVLRVQAAGYRAGRKIPGGMNGSPGYGPGEGEAIAWIFFSGDETIDEVRVVAHDARWKPLTEVSVKVDARWRPDAPQRERAAWAQALNDAQQRAISADMQRTQEGPLAALGLLLVQVPFFAVPGYLLLQVLTLWRWRGGWRRAAAVPLLLMIPVMLFCLYALAKGSNLWPLSMIFLSPVGFLYLGILWLLRRKSPSTAVR